MNMSMSHSYTRTIMSMTLIISTSMIRWTRPGSRTLIDTLMSGYGTSIPTFRTSTTNTCTERLDD
jgi:hypothetical protein